MPVKTVDPAYLYLVAIGSNRRHRFHGLPSTIVLRAAECLDQGPLELIRHSSVIKSRPIGPSQRYYANSAAIIATDLMPAPMLQHLKKLEGKFGARHPRRWTSRALDLDIILWRKRSSTADLQWLSPDLIIPHNQMQKRDFVLGPAKEIAGAWRDHVSGFTVGQLYHRLKKPVGKS